MLAFFTVSYKVKINKDHSCQINLMFGYNIFIRFHKFRKLGISQKPNKIRFMKGRTSASMNKGPKKGTCYRKGRKRANMNKLAGKTCDCW